MRDKAEKLLRAVASFQADVLLTIIYWLGVGPTALLSRLSGRDALALRGGAPAWTPREPVEPAEHLAGQG